MNARFNLMFNALMLGLYIVPSALMADSIDIIVEVEASDILSARERDELRSTIETIATRSGSFQTIDNEQREDILEELAFAQSGLTEEVEIGFLRAADGFIYAKVEAGFRGVSLSLTYVDQSRSKFTGRAPYDRDAPENSATSALNDILSQMNLPPVEDRSNNRDTGNVSALWRSALFPGWGQYYQENYIKSGTFATLTLILGAAMISEQSSASSAAAEYNNYSLIPLLPVDSSLNFPSGFTSLILSQDARSRVDQANSASTDFAAGLAILYIINLFDAYYFGSTLLSQADNQSNDPVINFALNSEQRSRVPGEFRSVDQSASMSVIFQF